MDNNPVNLTDVMGLKPRPTIVKGGGKEGGKKGTDYERTEVSKDDWNAYGEYRLKTGETYMDDGSYYKMLPNGKCYKYVPADPEEQEDESKEADPTPGIDEESEEDEEEEPNNPIDRENKVIHLAFPDGTSPLGSSDNSEIARLIREAGFGGHKHEVGHSAILLIDGDDGSVTYTDFGRFGGHQPGNGITRINPPEIPLPKAEFDDDGRLVNQDEILKAVLKNSHYRILDYASVVVDDDNMKKMQDFAQNRGEVGYGFDDGQTYCTDFAIDLMIEGGVAMKDWNIPGYADRLKTILKSNDNKLKKAAKLLQLKRDVLKNGPLGDNVNDYIEDSGQTDKRGVLKK